MGLLIYRASIVVRLREGVLDPHGHAVLGGLKRLGYTGVRDVRIGRQIEIELEADDEATAANLVDEACRRLLVNPAVEEYRFQIDHAGEKRV